MHYSWKVAHGQIAPKDVPAIKGCDIIWDHGDLATSKKAAREMVRLFHMAHQASLTSNHINGLAVDMTIHWQGSLDMVNGAGKAIEVKTGAQLHLVGASYGVHKLVSDPPHWSANGH